MSHASGPAPDEASWERACEDLLARVRHLATALDRPPVVGISGHGGAGKSTLALRLAAELGVAPDQVVGLDSCYAPDAHVPRGLADLHDWDVVLPLLARARDRPTPTRLAFPTRWYDGTTGRRDVAMPPVLLVEGIRLLDRRTRPLLDLAVWVDLDVGTAAARAVARNRAQGDDRAELDLWRTRWVPEGREHERQERPRDLADVELPAWPGSGTGQAWER